MSCFASLGPLESPTETTARRRSGSYLVIGDWGWDAESHGPLAFAITSHGSKR